MLFLPLITIAGEGVPDFTLEDINGNSVKSSTLIGKGPLIINFWASWCKPCLKELPTLNNLQAKYDTLVTVVCISTDRPRALPSVKSLIKSQKFSFITLIDQNSEVQKLFNVTSIPKTFLINKEGEIVYEHTGYNRGDERYLEEELLKMLSGNNSIDTLKTQEGTTPENMESIENHDL